MGGNAQQPPRSACEGARNPRNFPINTAASHRPRPGGSASRSTRLRRIDDFEWWIGGFLFTRDVRATLLTGEAGCFGRRARGGRLSRASAGQPLRYAVRRSPGRRNRGFGGTAPTTEPSPMGPESGVFPGHTCTLGGKIIPLEMELRWPLDIWPSYHPGGAASLGCSA